MSHESESNQPGKSESNTALAAANARSLRPKMTAVRDVAKVFPHCSADTGFGYKYSGLRRLTKISAALSSSNIGSS